jgi:hypothetical protein
MMREKEKIFLMQETTFIFMREFEERKRERGLDENLF